MDAPAPAALIGLDWGTTSARAYRFGREGNVLGERSGPLGIQQVRDGRFAEALTGLLGPWADDAVPRIACGMIGSRQGWVEAAYVQCPADLRTLADRLARVESGRLAIVPGVSTRDEHAIPDVIRGEETQLLGALAPDSADVLAVLPGTHSKWAHVARGRLIDFRTYMTGEIYAVMLEHSILGRLAQARADTSGEAARGFMRGVERGLASGALAHDLFGARTLALHGELANHEVADWLSGLLIGREIADARRWATARGLDGAPVHVVGTAALAARYASGLQCAGWPIADTPSDAAARGLWRIAVAANLVDGASR
ncbi:MAG TPA: 2-dehydro-3-deoxygalactonokinase [Casimicrobiaceae bacterium]|nr:2-dehydro-3-deoxygalactonokinase [Casimicrobiaceae bacterium]